MDKIRISRRVYIPDEIRIARYKKVPELGPKILFFSGGSALKKLSEELINYTHNSIHLVTPFDSGGSSAKLREAFNMLAVGDLRYRIMALSDQSVQGNPDIFNLFAYRFPKQADQEVLREQLKIMIDGEHILIKRISDPMRKLIRYHLEFFYNQMPDDFDLRVASIGNLILVGGYLNNKYHIDPVIFLFSKLVESRGIVRPVISSDLHLVAELEDGEVIIGQHLMSGKEAPPIQNKVKRLSLSKHRSKLEPVEVEVRNKVKQLIADAELICFPIGSFYSSVIANLLPKGVSNCIKNNDCPKVYIPNLGSDPEAFGLSLHDLVQTLLSYLKNNADEDVKIHELLNFVIVDTENGNYPEPLGLDELKAMGIKIIDTQLVSTKSAPLLDETLLIKVLLSLV